MMNVVTVTVEKVFKVMGSEVKVMVSEVKVRQ